MNQAVIKTGGKQYLVSEGKKIKVEKLPIEDGKAVSFGEVLLTKTDKTLKLGSPLVTGAKVEGKIVKTGKREKVFGAKVKAKKRYKKYFGHRQTYTEVEITKITSK